MASVRPPLAGFLMRSEETLGVEVFRSAAIKAADATD
jgi:hypothetical protein